MLIQFGYVILFSSAFPMAGMCALINNVIEIRSDAFKLCSSMRRPFGQRVENIGSWQVIRGLLSQNCTNSNSSIFGKYIMHRPFGQRVENIGLWQVIRARFHKRVIAMTVIAIT